MLFCQFCAISSAQNLQKSVDVAVAVAVVVVLVVVVAVTVAVAAAVAVATTTVTTTATTAIDRDKLVFFRQTPVLSDTRFADHSSCAIVSIERPIIQIAANQLKIDASAVS